MKKIIITSIMAIAALSCFSQKIHKNPILGDLIIKNVFALNVCLQLDTTYHVVDTTYSSSNNMAYQTVKWRSVKQSKEATLKLFWNGKYWELSGFSIDKIQPEININSKWKIVPNTLLIPCEGTDSLKQNYYYNHMLTPVRN